MKKPIDMESAKVKKDLVEFFHEKFSDKSKKEIAEEIEESLNENGRYSSYGTCYSVTVDGEEFNLVPSFDTFNAIAINYVEDMLENEPETFNQDFISQHLYITDTDSRIIASEETDAYINDMSDREIASAYYDKHGEHQYLDVDDEDEDFGSLDYEYMRVSLEEDFYEDIKKRLDDPLEYFVNDLGAYSVEDLLKSNFINIDVEAAAKEAVQVDGEAHFLSHYDGNYEETNLGIIVMKE